MKYIYIVPDGAADYPQESLAGKTPLEAADLRNIRKLAAEGILGRVKTIPAGFKPASDVANLSLLGYEPQIYYRGRGPLEAANLGIELSEADLAFRCNLITEAQDQILDYSAGHIADKEASLIIDLLNKELSTDAIKFYHGTSYRNLMVYRDATRLGLDKLTYWPPHDVLGRKLKDCFPQGENSQILVRLMQRSQEILKDHEINHVRIDLKENPANMIWLWGCGHKPTMPTFKEKFGLVGAVISAVDLIRGIGRLVEMKVLTVPGANGYYDTNYSGKAQAALAALKEVDFVFIHVEAPDEAGHNGDLRMKITCLERIDKLIVGPLISGLAGEDFRILVTPDHPTPVEKRTHTNEPVPFLISGKGISSSGYNGYSEEEAARSNLYFDSGVKLMEYFLR